MNQFGSPWTEEREAHFRELASLQQYSAGQMAAILGGGLTRMSVIGKARREGIALRPHNSKQLAVSRNCAAKLEPALQPKPRMKFEKPIEVDSNIPPDHSPFACTIMELESGMCRYPMGDPGTPEFRFCGTPECEGSYCDRHHALCYWDRKRYSAGPDDQRQFAMRRRTKTTTQTLNREFAHEDTFA